MRFNILVEKAMDLNLDKETQKIIQAAHTSNVGTIILKNNMKF